MTLSPTIALDNGINPRISHNCLLPRKASANDGICGRSVTIIKETTNTLVNAVIETTNFVFSSLANICSNTNALAGVFRKLYKHCIQLTEHLTDAHGKYAKLSHMFRSTVDVIDSVQMWSDGNFFINGYFNNARYAEIGSRGASLVANIGGTLMWLQEMAFINLSTAAATLGNYRVFSFVPQVLSSVPVLRDISSLQLAANSIGELRVFSVVSKLSPLNVTLRALDLMYTFLAINAAQKIASSNNTEQLIGASIDLSSYLAELTLSAVVCAGVTNVVALGVIGGACISLAVSSFLYGIYNSEKINEKPQKAIDAA